MRKIAAVAAWGLLLGGSGGYSQDEDPSSPKALAAFKKDVRPLLATYCFGCHGPEKQKAKLRIDALNPDLVGGPHAETWHEVQSQLNRGEMPPEGKPAPTSEERRAIVGWLTAELKRAADAKAGTGQGTVLRRLTRYEYRNTLRDLLGLDLDFARNLPPEPSSKDGFRNNGAALGISALQIQTYLETAREALDKVIVAGPRPEVHRFTIEKNMGKKRKRKKNQPPPPPANRIRPGDEYWAVMKTFPREGEVRVTIVAESAVPEGSPAPLLRVTMGVRADVKAPAALLGEAEVLPSKKGPMTYTFTGRIEEFPLPGHNPKFPGLLIKVMNGLGNPNAPKPKRGKKPAEPAKPVPEIVVSSVTFEGPIFASWPPKSHTEILFMPKPAGDERAYARAIVRRFISRAYRRPAIETDVRSAMAVYDAVRSEAPSFDAAIRDVLATVLVSPEFLYLVEPLDPQGPARQPLTDFELASRLSYFLWSTMPDARLRELAGRGILRDPATLEKEVRRMLADDRSWAFVEHFTDQWLDLSGMDRVAVNPEYYPDFDDRLKKDMRLETQHFFAEILRKDLSALNLLDSDFAILNGPLAKHYGIEGPRSRAFERIALKPSDRRGGLLTQGSTLLTNSTGEDSHPIRRAVWILARLLDDPPAPPPPDVPDLESEDPDFAKLSIKRQLELHRKKEACNDCHRGIDPWGIPLENFDAVGLWRTEVKRVLRKRKVEESPVVSRATLPGGHEVDGIEALKAHLTKNEGPRFSRAMTRKILAYGLGRSLGMGDRAEGERLAEGFARNGYVLSRLIVEIVKSDAFTTKQGTLKGAR